MVADDGFDMQSNEVTDNNQMARVQNVSMQSFGANSTAMTFSGAKVEGAFLVDPDEAALNEIQITEQRDPIVPSDTPSSKKVASKPPLGGKVTSPKVPATKTRPAKKFDVGKKQDIDDLGEPTPDIKLTLEEAKTLKKVVFRNLITALDANLKKVAEKEANATVKAVVKNIESGLLQIGEHKTCEQIIKENIKDYRGIVKAVGFDSPNKRIKEILGPVSGAKNAGGPVLGLVAAGPSS